MARTVTLDKKVLTGAGVAVLVFGALVFGTGAASGAGAAEPVPAVTVSVTGPATTVTEAGPETTVKVPGKATTVTKAVTKTITRTITPSAARSGDDTALNGSTCDNAREAILTGTQSGIASAMNKLVADKSADSTAREYARYYLGRDKSDPEMRELDIGLIQSACSL